MVSDYLLINLIQFRLLGLVISFQFTQHLVESLSKVIHFLIVILLELSVQPSHCIHVYLVDLNVINGAHPFSIL